MSRLPDFGVVMGRVPFGSFWQHNGVIAVVLFLFFQPGLKVPNCSINLRVQDPRTYQLQINPILAAGCCPSPANSLVYDAGQHAVRLQDVYATN